MPHNPTGQEVIERANQTLKEMFIKQTNKKGGKPSPSDRLNNALLTLNFLNGGEKEEQLLETLGHQKN